MITGPESSGKTTLTRQLVEHFKAVEVTEFARDYLSKRNGKYGFEDLALIAKGQLEIENAANHAGTELLICDTSLEVLKIWSQVRFGKVDDFIASNVVKNLPDLFLLCKPDLQWQEDSLRENPHNRDQLFEMYNNELENLNVTTVLIEGVGNERFHLGAGAIRKLLPQIL